MHACAWKTLRNHSQLPQPNLCLCGEEIITGLVVLEETQDADKQLLGEQESGFKCLFT